MNLHIVLATYPFHPSVPDFETHSFSYILHERLSPLIAIPEKNQHGLKGGAENIPQVSLYHMKEGRTAKEPRRKDPTGIA